MRTTISSDSTRVPPVTAERSPPDSRITGADSPVIADSSTLAMPSITSPSLGITSPATTTHLVAEVERGARARPRSCRRRRRRWATVSERVLRSVSACALPRPSAIASAKFANSTVNQRNSATRPVNTFSFVRRRAEVLEEQDRGEHASRPRRRTSPGCASACRGLSLTKLSPIARADDLAARRAWCPWPCERAPRVLEAELLDDGAEREDGEEREARRR